MAFMCKRTSGKECDACGACEKREAIYCGECGNEIEEGEEVYETEFYTTLCERCLKRIYRK